MKFLEDMIDQDLNWKSHNTVFMHYSKNDVRYSHKITENSKYTNIAQPIFYFIHTDFTIGIIVWSSACKTYLEPLLKKYKQRLPLQFFNCNIYV